jgi:hypothetical protein
MERMKTAQSKGLAGAWKLKINNCPEGKKGLPDEKRKVAI